MLPGMPQGQEGGLPPLLVRQHFVLFRGCCSRRLKSSTKLHGTDPRSYTELVRSSAFRGNRSDASFRLKAELQTITQKPERHRGCRSVGGLGPAPGGYPKNT